jgi:Family of unknown function (DUF6513)
MSDGAFYHKEVELPPRMGKLNLIFVTGRLAAGWLEEYLQDFSHRFQFNYEVIALDIDVAAFITCKYVADKLVLSDEQRTRTDYLVLPGFAGGDLAKVEEVVGVQALRGPNDLAGLDSFLAELCHANHTSSPAHYYTEAQLRAMQARITDKNIRIFIDGERIFAFNNEVFAVGGTTERDMRNIFRQLKVDNASHAFYLGREFHKAATAIRLKIPYHQDRELVFTAEDAEVKINTETRRNTEIRNPNENL